MTTSSKRERLEDFLKVLDENFQLTEEDIKAIDDAGAKLHFRKYWTEDIDGNKIRPLNLFYLIVISISAYLTIAYINFDICDSM